MQAPIHIVMNNLHRGGQVSRGFTVSLLLIMFLATVPGVVPSAANELDVIWVLYSDSGIPPQADLYVWHGPADGNDVDFSWPGGCIYDPDTSAKTVTIDWAGWGVFLVHPVETTVDLISAGCASLEFCVKSPCDLPIEVEDDMGGKSREWISDHGWIPGQTEWQHVSISIQAFAAGNADLARAFGVFLVTATETCTFYIDYVRWFGCPPPTATESWTWGAIKAMYGMHNR